MDSVAGRESLCRSGGRAAAGRSVQVLGVAGNSVRHDTTSRSISGADQIGLTGYDGAAGTDFGFHQSQVRERLAALFYSTQIHAHSLHKVEQNLDLASAAGAVSLLRTFAIPHGTPEGPLPTGDFVLTNPLAGWRSKQWPLEFYRTLADRVKRELGMPLVLNGPPESAELLGKVSGAIPMASGISGLIHATRIATAVVGVDSGPLHLAAGLGKPGVAIFGPTDPSRNGPYGESITVLRSPNAITTYKGDRPSIPACGKSPRMMSLTH